MEYLQKMHDLDRQRKVLIKVGQEQKVILAAYGIVRNYTKGTPMTFETEQGSDQEVTVAQFAAAIFALQTGHGDDDPASATDNEGFGADGEEQAEESLSTSSEPSDAGEPLLDKTIANASSARLRSVLKFVCAKNEFAKQLTAHQLLMPVGKGEPRKRKRFETCKDCGM